VKANVVLLAALMSSASVLPAMAADGVRSVTLSSGGLAEVTRSVYVDGDGTVLVEVPSTQVDDVLKSLVVGDPSGSVASMTLDGMQQAEETFRALPFTSEDLRSLPTLLGAVQGTKVRVSSGGKTVEGKVLGMSEQSLGSEGGSVRILTVISDAGSLEVLPLGTDASVAILDAAMLEKVSRAAEASGRERAAGSKVVEIRVSGTGKREVSISYVVAAPIWKAAYRIVSKPDGKAHLQAWAVIENATGEDWDNVAVTLSSGSPVTLTQRLYQRYWRERPEIPVDSASNAVPEADGGTERAKLSQGRAAMSSAVAAYAPAPAPMPQDMVMEAAPRMSAPAETGTVAEGDVTATYALPARVDLPAGRTLSVPIVDATVDAKRVSVFQPQSGGKHPVAALMLKNDTGASLPPGILTVYDERDGYVGDARLLGIPAGDERMASFATDTKVEVIAEEKPEDDISQVAVEGGVAKISYLTRATTTYEVRGAQDGKRTVVIEHPKRDGWEFKSEALRGTTVTARRLAVEVAAKETKVVTAVDEMVRLEGYALADADETMLSRWSSATNDPATAAKLSELALARTKATAAERRLADIDEEVGRISEEQGRIRQNLGAVPSQSELATNYLRDMKDQEDALGSLRTQRKEADVQLKQYRDSVGAIIRTF
jgi:hypothetical protein